MTYSDELVDWVALAIVNEIRSRFDYGPIFHLEIVLDADIYRAQARAALDAAGVGEMLEALRNYAKDYDHERGHSMWDGGASARATIAKAEGRG